MPTRPHPRDKGSAFTKVSRKSYAFSNGYARGREPTERKAQARRGRDPRHWPSTCPNRRTGERSQSRQEPPKRRK